MGAYENWTDLQAVIDVVAGETLLPADGLSETMVTAVVLDSSGNPVQNAAVNWAPSDGDVFPGQTTTNSAGQATAILISSTDHVMATVSATSGGVVGSAYVQFGDATDPTAWIGQPGAGATVSGDVEVTVEACDGVGGGPGVCSVYVFVDGAELDSTPGPLCDAQWGSYRLPNGPHQITATATDYEGNMGRSNVVNLVSQNGIEAFSVIPATAAPGQQVYVSAQLAVPGDWYVTVTDISNSLVWSTSGSGTAISADWTAPSEGDVYTVAAVATATGDSAALPVAVNTTDTPAFLLVETLDAAGPRNIIKNLVATARRRGLAFQVLWYDDATWSNISTILSNTGCHYLFLDCHGNHKGAGGEITRIWLPADKTMAYAQQIPDSASPGTFLPGRGSGPEHVWLQGSLRRLY